MASYGGVPLAGLNGFPVRAALQVQFSFGVEQMQVYYRVQCLAAVMGLTAQDAAQHVSILIDYGKKLVVVIGHTACCLMDNHF